MLEIQQKKILESSEQQLKRMNDTKFNSIVSSATFNNEPFHQSPTIKMNSNSIISHKYKRSFGEKFKSVSRYNEGAVV